MSKPSMRRFGALMVVVLLVSAVLVPAAAAAPAESGASSVSQGGYSCPIYYRVVRGDNLTKIAYRYGVTVGQLMAWNHIYNPDRIYIGQVLVIYPWNCRRPAPPKPPAPPHPPMPPKPPAPPPCGGCQCGGCPPPPPPPPPSGPWTGTYYNSMDLSGPVVMQRGEKSPCYNWGWGSPGYGVSPDYFSVRWTTSANAAGGTYRLNVTTDDGARVYVDGNLVLDQWFEQSVRQYCVDIYLAPGWHNWTVEYFEQTGLAQFCLTTQRLY